MRASEVRSNSLRLGLVIRSSLRHCSIGRSTAASTPRLVTICGPSARAVSRSSLNLDLASWTGHLLLMIYTSQLNMTSCKTSLQGHSMSSEPGCGHCFNLADFGSRSSLASSARGQVPQCRAWVMGARTSAHAHRLGSLRGCRRHGTGGCGATSDS